MQAGKFSRNAHVFCRVQNGEEFAVVFSFDSDRNFRLFDCLLIDYVRKEKIECPEQVTPRFRKASLAFDEGEGFLRYQSEFCDFSLRQDEAGVAFHADYAICFSHTEMTADLRLSAPRQTLHTAAGETVAFHLAAQGSLTVAGRTYTFGPGAEATAVTSLGKTVRCTESFLCSTADGGIYSYRLKNGGETLTTDGVKGDALSVSDGAVLQPRTLSGAANGTFTPFFNERMDYARPFLHSHADRLHGRFESGGNNCFAVLTLSRKA